MLDSYVRDLFKTFQAGDAREESFYPDLKALLEAWIERSKRRYSVTALPKRTEGGNPDFRVRMGKSDIVGYIEAKTFDADLSKVERTEQLKRYRETFPNLILTNFFEFRLYRNGEPVVKTFIGRPFVMRELKMVPPAEHEKEFLELLEKFFAFSVPETKSAKQLALELAKRTRFLRDQVIVEALEEEKIEGTQTLEGFYQAFREHLIPSLTPQGFSDLFAQTITYGLFAARSRADNGFARELAYKYVPQTVGILSHLFRVISSSELPKQMEWIIDDIAEVLAASNVNKIIHDFYAEGKGKDPIMHFYETFLAEYDPKEREKRGVYYTPEPVVSYITRSIHHLLKDKFGKADGFATSSVTVLDPASGTLTFPALAIQQAIKEYTEKYGKGKPGVSALIRDHILKNFYAFELMMAPYAIGHLKIGFVLDEYGYQLAEDERFKLYLTNTLDFMQENPEQLPGMVEQKIAEESRHALKVKEETPIMVVMGNPPYSRSSSNIIKKGTDFYDFYESYKETVRKEERNIQPLSDDYIKFIAFAHWKVKQLGEGVVGMITNNSYLDGRIHRDVRRKLSEDFEVFILNLHGDASRDQINPAGVKDENVFDIRQGVSIVLLIRGEGGRGKVHYFEKFGTREEKYKFLEENSISTTKWHEVELEHPYYSFVPRGGKGENTYEKFLPLEKIFQFYNVAGKPGDDKVLVAYDTNSLIGQLIGTKELLTMDKNNADTEAKKKFLAILQSFSLKRENVIPYNYRPFDIRYTYYDPQIYTRAVPKLKRQFDSPNLALLTTKILKAEPFAHTFATEVFPDVIFLSNKTSTNTFAFPLYLYNDGKGQQTLLGGQEKLGLKGVQHSLRAKKDKEPNIAAAVFEALQKAFGKKPSPEEIFYYIYAVFYSNVYRKKYKEFLKSDFPRVPFTKDYKLFQMLAELGKQLLDLHLLRAKELEKPTVKFEGGGKGLVEKPKYDEKRKRAYINEQDYFEGVAPEAWNYFIGGYQVLHKWLKDRSGRTLSTEDIRHYTRIATALTLTLALQKDIDKLYPRVEKIIWKRQ